MASIKELNLSEQEGLQAILDKDESAWIEQDIAHLKARSEYLSSDDKVRLEKASGRFTEEKTDEAPKKKTKKTDEPES